MNCEKKIIIICGTHAEPSVTWNCCFDIFTKVKSKYFKKYNRNLDIELISLLGNPLEYCIGCNKCFYTGLCSLDEKDHFNVLKEKLLNADLIVFASPIYAHHISGSMKNFLDRLSYYMHLMRFKDKTGLIITTSSHIYKEEPLNYIYHIMSLLGINVLGRFNFNNSIKVDDIDIEAIFNIVENDDTYNEDLNEIFNVLKYKYTTIIKKSGVNNFETKFWQNNLLNFNNFHDLLLHKEKSK